MKPFVVDANVMNCFQGERINAEVGEATKAIEAIINAGFIALDEEGHCQAEWVECAGGKPPLALLDWIADMFIQEKIRLSPYNVDSMYGELYNLGVPKKDHKWVRLARSSGSNVIVTEDIDLFDPSKKKNCSASNKAKIKSQRKGPVAKHLAKKYDISVICIEHVRDFALAS